MKVDPDTALVFFSATDGAFDPKTKGSVLVALLLLPNENKVPDVLEDSFCAGVGAEDPNVKDGALLSSI